MRRLPNWCLSVSDPDSSAPVVLIAREPKRSAVEAAVSELGYSVCCFDPDQADALTRLTQQRAAAWLVELAEESPLTDWLLEHSELPVLLGVGLIPAPDSEDYPRCLRRLYAKLAGLVGESPRGKPELHRLPCQQAEAGPSGVPSASCVWVLAASLGGPAAVKTFLDHLPASLPLSLVYAQHIDPGFEQQLPQIIGRHNDWQIHTCVPERPLYHGEVLVVPVDQRLRFSPEGRVRLSQEAWPGPYQPAIAAVIDEVRQSFAPTCGAIVFSGMGEDGVEACTRLRDQGMPVWTQSAESAACATMPEAIRQAGVSSLQGDPEQLASAMRRWMEQESVAAL
ncbi:MAG: chemotaxis protein CheB [Pseudomonadaceae bacterium]|nr:MAG: chemotaxis protein CheB [Pseudomonadaceae bacterium]